MPQHDVGRAERKGNAKAHRKPRGAAFDTKPALVEAVGVMATDAPVLGGAPVDQRFASLRVRGRMLAVPATVTTPDPTPVP